VCIIELYGVIFGEQLLYNRILWSDFRRTTFVWNFVGRIACARLRRNVQLNLSMNVISKIVEAVASKDYWKSVFYRGSTVLGRVTYMRFLELFRHMVGLLGRVFSPSQGLYLYRTTQHRKTRTNVHAMSGIRTQQPTGQAAKTHASDRTATVTGCVCVSE
jgi:hypothetical protein